MMNLLIGLLVGIVVALCEGAYQLRKIHNVLDGISLLMYHQSHQMDAPGCQGCCEDDPDEIEVVTVH